MKPSQSSELEDLLDEFVSEANDLELASFTKAQYDNEYRLLRAETIEKIKELKRGS